MNIIGRLSRSLSTLLSLAGLASLSGVASSDAARKLANHGSGHPIHRKYLRRDTTALGRGYQDQWTRRHRGTPVSRTVRQHRLCLPLGVSTAPGRQLSPELIEARRHQGDFSGRMA